MTCALKLNTNQVSGCFLLQFMRNYSTLVKVKITVLVIRLLNYYRCYKQARLGGMLEVA